MCGQSGPSLKWLQYHNRLQHPAPRVSCVCQFCGKSFQRKIYGVGSYANCSKECAKYMVIIRWVKKKRSAMRKQNGVKR